MSAVNKSEYIRLYSRHSMSGAILLSVRLKVVACVYCDDTVVDSAECWRLQHANNVNKL